MKTFRMIGMALFAVLMCVNFASCGGSDDEPIEEEKEEDVVVSKKKLIEMTWANSSETIHSYKFTYDNNGKLSKLKHEVINKDGEVAGTANYSYNWSDNQIKISWDEIPEFDSSCNINNNLITEVKDFNGLKYTFTYDDSQKMIEYKYNDKTRNTYRWGVDCITQFIYNNTNGAEIYYLIEYQSFSSNKGWLDLDCFVMGLPIYVKCLILSNPNLLGNNFFSGLPRRIKSENSSDNWNFTYTLDEEKYVQKCRVMGEYFGVDITNHYTYKWQ